jgi:hypothetical protein
MRKKLIGGLIVAALAVPAAPAFAFHDNFVPADNCSGPSPGNSQAVGHPAVGIANLGNSNNVLPDANNASPPCRFGQN